MKRDAPPFILMLAILGGALIVHGRALWNAAIPLNYTGDGLFSALIVKSVLQQGWFPATNPFLGAPFGSAPFDFPGSEASNYLLVHLLGLFGDWPFVVNAFVIVGYFLVAIAAYWVLSRFGLRGPWPMVGALLFALMPYHAMRAQFGHLFLSAYYAVPLGVWLAWTIWHRPGDGKARDGVATFACSVVAGSAGIYYAFFSSYLVVIATLAGLAGPDRRRSLRRGLVILALIVLTVLANVMPSIVYKKVNGANQEVAARSFEESERYGLKLIQLVLPRTDHRLAAAREMNDRYTKSTLLANENISTSIGLVASIGLFILLWWGLKRMFGTTSDRPLEGFLCAITIASVLLATIGGLGTVFAFSISPEIRAYNRISIFIAFMALTAFLVLLSRWLGGPAHTEVSYYTSRTRSRTAYAPWVVASIVLAIGIYDQTSPADFTPAYRSFASDRVFVSGLESRLAPGAMVYQLPYQRYPEGRNPLRIDPYGPAKGYLNSRSLRWSFGQVMGREGDRWMLALGRLPLPQQMDIAARSGFSAVVLDRRGYPDGGKAAEAELRNKLGAPLAVSGDERLVAYRIHPTGNRPLSLEEFTPRFEKLDLSAPALPASVTRISGFSVPEPWGRWTDGPLAKIECARDLPKKFLLEIRTIAALPPSVNTPIVVSIGGVERTFMVGASATDVELPFQLSGSASTIELRIPRPTSPAELGISSDPRKLGIGIRAIEVREQVARRP